MGDAGEIIATAPTRQRIGPLMRRPVRIPLLAGRELTLEVWEAIFYGLLIIGILLSRYLALGSRAYHHDESIHAKSMWDIAAHGVGNYVYDPVYHGPFQYFTTAAVFRIFGGTEFTGRIVPAAFGVAAVLAIPWLWRKELGRLGTPITMLALTVSMGFLYFSRFARNDIYIAFWTLVIFGSLVRYLDKPDRRWIWLAGLAMGASFITKENTFITGFIFVSFVALLGVWAYATSRGIMPDSGEARKLRAAFRSLGADPEAVAYGLLIFALIAVVFMSSFLTNLAGVRRSFVDAFAVWRDIHGTQRVNQPWFFYLMFLGVYEIFATVFALAAIPRIVRRPSVFTALLLYWAGASILIYSAAGEKAAWLALHPILPLTVIAGWFAGQKLQEARSGPRLWGLALACVVLLGWTARHSIPTTFVHGDVPLDFVIYTQTSRDVLEAIEIMEEAGRRTGQGRNIPIFLESETHWPYAWYLREWGAVAYAPVADEVPEQPIVLLSDETADKIGVQFTDHVGYEFKLREWFPEHTYNSWNWGSPAELFKDGDNFRKLWRFLVLKEPPDSLGSTNFVMYVRRDILKGGPIGPFTYEPPGP